MLFLARTTPSTESSSNLLLQLLQPPPGLLLDLIRIPIKRTRLPTARVPMALAVAAVALHLPFCRPVHLAVDIAGGIPTGDVLPGGVVLVVGIAADWGMGFRA